MAGGAGSVGGSSGMGQQPMGNAYAQPNGGSFGGGYGGSPFGMQQQQPYGMQQMQNPYINSMPGPSSAGGYMGQPGAEGFPAFGGQQQQGPDQSRVLRMPMGQLPPPNQTAQPMPQQPQQPAYQNNPDYQAYQTQMNDLSRQMDEYVKKAPMYQQLQDLQGKMRGFQQPPPESVADNRMGMPPPGMGGYGGGFGRGRGGFAYGGRGGSDWGRQMPMGQAGLAALLGGRSQQTPMDFSRMQELM